MIKVEHLTKSYGSHLALQDVSFSVAEGEILGFLGPNGAGKSTTMNILTGYLSATSGTVTVNGFDVLKNPNGAKASIGYLPEQPPLYMDMTVREYLDFMYDLKKCTLPRAKHLAEIAEVVKIKDVFGRLIKNLSKGYRQRIGLAQALIGNPPVLILDEPTVGLDPNQIIEIRSLIRKLGQYHTVILSSHILPEVEAVCDRLVIINGGRIVADGTAAQLAAENSADHRLTVRVAGPAADVKTLLSSIHGVEQIALAGEKEPGAQDLVITPAAGADVRPELFRRLADRGWPILELRSNKLSLEEIFLSLTGGDNAAPQKGGDAT
ncbi:MAG: ATP-binding cassette domain-containing protein [Clostridia bacterium]|nr:ATP-binding cassette domain-containing protein [Clostridia bacterium]